ncbi:esterase/lipase family protein [Jidongwangia harbinensis]|uniref:esterase/lipase family protein n=1 Tax=Jidongwangia harbinensis TaxID=2878561 RepID=UPI001CD98495|nr:alpha/beta fold hydrolase [Jidongwangia harbinensis]MCA2213974.1 hypothetical protein [Jidongwangia harbinensis]
MRICAALLAVALSGAVPAPASATVRAAGEPVILVHGWAGSPSAMLALRDAFAAAGHPAYPIDLPGEENVANAQAIAGLVAEVTAATGQPRVHLVAHSMGGLSARYYLKRLGGTPTVRTYVSMGTAQYGYLPACLLGPAEGGQMCPGSDFLRDLNEGDDTPGDVAYATFRSAQENARNVRLDGGACHLVIPGVGHADQPAAPAFVEAALSTAAGRCPGTFVDTPPG